MTRSGHFRILPRPRRCPRNRPLHNKNRRGTCPGSVASRGDQDEATRFGIAEDGAGGRGIDGHSVSCCGSDHEGR